MKKIKIISAVSIITLVIVGIVFSASNTNLFKGKFSFQGPSSSTETSTSDSTQNTEDEEEALALAETYMQMAQDYADQAEDCAESLNDYYGWENAECTASDSAISGTSWYDGSTWDAVENFCLNENQLVVYYCIADEDSVFDGTAFGEVFNCDEGTLCSNGACISESTVEDEEATTEEATTEETVEEIIEDTTEETTDTDEPVDTDLEILTDKNYKCLAPFTDTKDEMICRAYRSGIVSGKSQGIFDPYAEITRAEFIKILILTMGEDPLFTSQNIMDMDSSHWAFGYVNRAKQMGIITESTFNPDVSVTRGTAMVWIIRGAEESLPQSEWADRIPWSDMSVNDGSTYAAIIANDTKVSFMDQEEVSVVQGYSDGTFKPDNKILRYESIYLIYRSYLAWFNESNTFLER